MAEVDLDLLRNDDDGFHYELDDDDVLEILSYIIVDDAEHWRWEGSLQYVGGKSYPRWFKGKQAYSSRHVIIDLFVERYHSTLEACTKSLCGLEICVNPEHFTYMWRKPRLSRRRPKTSPGVTRHRKETCAQGHTYEPNNYYYRVVYVHGIRKEHRCCLICAELAKERRRTRSAEKLASGYRDGGNWRQAARQYLDSL